MGHASSDGDKTHVCPAALPPGLTGNMEMLVKQRGGTRQCRAMKWTTRAKRVRLMCNLDETCECRYEQITNSEQQIFAASGGSNGEEVVVGLLGVLACWCTLRKLSWTHEFAGQVASPGKASWKRGSETDWACDWDCMGRL